ELCVWVDGYLDIQPIAEHTGSLVEPLGESIEFTGEVGKPLGIGLVTGLDLGPASHAPFAGAAAPSGCKAVHLAGHSAGAGEDEVGSFPHLAGHGAQLVGVSANHSSHRRPHELESSGSGRN